MNPFVLGALGIAGLFAYESFAPIDYNDDPRQDMNLQAFLAVLRQGESNDDYHALALGGQFSSFADHPALTGEWAGVRRGDGRLTTAAGAYQITRTTWLDIRTGLPDFAPDSQDRAAVRLIKRRGAMDDIEAGRLDTAVMKLAPEWEFLSGNTGWQLAQVESAFANNGGRLA